MVAGVAAGQLGPEAPVSEALPAPAVERAAHALRTTGRWRGGAGLLSARRLPRGTQAPGPGSVPTKFSKFRYSS
eukprot:SAG31_NODE_818_length_11820_cov_22.864431_3_plen_74_part_00